MMKIYALAFALLAATTPLAAQTQADMNRTAQGEWQAADAHMTREWVATHAFMKARDAKDHSRGGGFGYAAATLASQRAWLKFRDAQCVIEAGRYAGGSMQPLARLTCQTALTRDRSRQLAALRWTSP